MASCRGRGCGRCRPAGCGPVAPCFLAGLRMLSSDDETGVRSASQAVLFCSLLLLIAGTPAFIGMTNSIYLLAEIILGGLFTAAAMRFHRAGDPANARLLFFSSIIYLPLLFAILMLTKL